MKYIITYISFYFHIRSNQEDHYNDIIIGISHHFWHTPKVTYHYKYVYACMPHNNNTIMWSSIYILVIAQQWVVAWYVHGWPKLRLHEGGHIRELQLRQWTVAVMCQTQSATRACPRLHWWVISLTSSHLTSPQQTQSIIIP